MSAFGDSTTEPLAPVDAAWLGMDCAENPMTITAVMILGTPIDLSRLKAVIEDRLLLHDRFRRRLERASVPWGRRRWVDDEDFNLHSHLKRVGLREPRDRAALQELVSDLMSVPLDRSRPLWQIHVVEDYRGGTALVIRIHHAVADGIALIRVLLSLTDDAPDAPSRAGSSAAVATGAEAESDHGAERVGLAAKALEHRPFSVLSRLWRGAVGADIVRRLLALPAEADTVLRGRLGGDKRAAWSDSIPLAHVKRIGAAFGVTVNDVALAAISGGVRDYLELREAVLPDDSLRAVVPVNLRTRTDEDELGNRFGLVFLELPVGVEGAVERLLEVHRRMNDLKASPQARVVFGVLGGVGTVGRGLERTLVKLFADKVTMVLTNVPGPRKRLYLAGAPLEDLLFWVPQSGAVGLGISILSYDGRVRLGVASDAALVPDPEAIVGRIRGELDTLLDESAQP